MLINQTYIKSLLLAFEEVFLSEKAINLLTVRWRAKHDKPGAPPSTGFCYIAAEAAYHILRPLRPKPFCASYTDDIGPCTHWWLGTKYGIVDPTATQYTLIGENPPYHLGVGRGFLTKKPSKRADVLIGLVKNIMKSNFNQFKMHTILTSEVQPVKETKIISNGY